MEGPAGAESGAGGAHPPLDSRRSSSILISSMHDVFFKSDLDGSVVQDETLT